MCGIYGILHLDGAPGAAEALRAMARLTVHRGPDDEGTYADGPLAFGMRRLSIIDVAGGHQPISNEDGTLWLVCNGEIYNFRSCAPSSPRRAIASGPPPTAKPSFTCTRSTATLRRAT